MVSGMVIGKKAVSRIALRGRSRIKSGIATRGRGFQPLGDGVKGPDIPEISNRTPL